MGSNREVKAAFNKFLATQGISEERWRTEIARNIQVRKTREQLQALLDEEKSLQAIEDKAVIDQRLADGESFAALAVEFSDAPGENQAEPLWIGRELALPQQAEAMFGTPVGEITDWIEVPSGWYRFEIVDKKLAEGEDFEAKRKDIILQLNSLNAEVEDYEPTEEEIASKYEQAQVIQIQLRIDNPGAANNELDKLMQEAHVEVNDPYILAYQALMLDHIQPPASMGFEQLVNTAKTAQVGEEYDFLLIQQKLDKALEMRIGGSEDEETAADEGLESADVALDEEAVSEDAEVAEDTSGEAGAASTEPSSDVTEEDEAQFYPLYPLAIGLFKMVIQDNEEAVGYFPYYMIADTYIKWLNDEDTRVKQPLERSAAREEIETNLARAAESNDYSYMLHAQRGLNLAWLERKEEALASLALAVKYLPHDDQNPVWEIVRQGYEVADAQEELVALEEKITEYRQAALQAQIEEAQREARTQQQTQVINIPGDEDSEAGNGPGVDESVDDSVADGGGADAVDEAGEGE
jgi:parvulin-like peptidyl-prolyl isomerase